MTTAALNDPSTEVEAEATTTTRDERRHRNALRSLHMLASFSLLWFVMNFVKFTFVAIAPVQYVVDRYTPEQLAYLDSLPTWSLFMSGLGVGFGIVASIALFLRREEAYYAFMLSLLMAIGHFIDALDRGAMTVMTPGEAASSFSQILITLFLFWAVYDAKRAGQLR